MYFADARWWEWHHNGVARRWLGTAVRWTVEEAREAFRNFRGQRVTIFNTGAAVQDPEVFMLRNGGETGISNDPTALRVGRNSGYQAVNLAVLAGARKVVLLGYDSAVRGNLTHWFGDHPVQTNASIIAQYKTHYPAMAAELRKRGVEVLDASGEGMGVFPVVPIEEALA